MCSKFSKSNINYHCHYQASNSPWAIHHIINDRAIKYVKTTEAYIATRRTGHLVPELSCPMSYKIKKEIWQDNSGTTSVLPPSDWHLLYEDLKDSNRAEVLATGCVMQCCAAKICAYIFIERYSFTNYTWNPNLLLDNEDCMRFYITINLYQQEIRMKVSALFGLSFSTW